MRMKLRCKNCGKRSYFRPVSFISQGKVRLVFECPKCHHHKLSNRGSVYSFLAIFFILLLVVVAIIFLNIYYDDAPKLVSANNSSSNSTVYYDVAFDNGVNATLHYNLFLFNGSDYLPLVLDGLSLPLTPEVVEHVPFNSTILLQSWSDQYYFNESLFLVSQNNSRYHLGLFRKASYNLLLYPSFVSLNISDGVLQDPIICFSHGANVVFVKMNLLEINVPEGFRNVADQCFQSDSLFGKTVLDFSLVKNPYYVNAHSLSVFVYDYEVNGRENVGLVNATIIIE